MYHLLMKILNTISEVGKQHKRKGGDSNPTLILEEGIVL